MERLLTLLRQSFLYFIIPVIPAIILRVKFPKTAIWIAVVPTIIGGICLIISLSLLILIEDIFNPLSMFFSYAAFCVPCSVPALYCAAFWNNGKKIWLAILPPIVFFAYWFARYWIMPDVGFEGAVNYLITGTAEDMLITYTAAGYGIGALVCIVITILITKFTKFTKFNELRKI